MRSVGRLVVRSGCAGLFIPITAALPTGLYEIREMLGEFTLTRIGAPAMRPEALAARSVDDLVGDPTALMTAAEIATARPRS